MIICFILKCKLLQMSLYNLQKYLTRTCNKKKTGHTRRTYSVQIPKYSKERRTAKVNKYKLF